MGFWKNIKKSLVDGVNKIDDKINLPIYHDFRVANEINETARQKYENILKAIEDVRVMTEKSLQLYGIKKLNIYDTSIRLFVYQFDRMKDVNLTEIQAQDNLPNRVLNAVKIKEINFQFIDGVKTLIAGGGVGAASGAIAFGTVGMLATASTGTAISGLSGAAATNATLAWLGGGSLATGGGGVALGTAVLGGLVLIPALVAGGFILNAKSKEALENARANDALVERVIAEAKVAIAAMNTIRSRCEQMNETATRLSNHLDSMNEKLKNLLDQYLRKYFFQRWIESLRNLLFKLLDTLNFRIPKWLSRPRRFHFAKLTFEEKQLVAIATTLAVTTKNLLDTDILSEDGTATAESNKILTEANEFITRNNMI